MKAVFSLFLALAILIGLLTGCAGRTDSSTAAPAATAEAEGPNRYDDGRARPSNAGRLRVVNGRLCGADGQPVMLRGVSTNGLVTSESFLNRELFRELARDDGVNLIRLAMYTYGVGVVGYCTGGDKERHKQDIAQGVELAKAEDMYVIIDWHVLSEGDPNVYLEDAKAFFAEMAERFRDYDNILYEICNEPNGVDWPTVKGYAEQIIPVIREKDPEAVVIVGTPDWSKGLDAAAGDPLNYDNLLYTLHFYAASHGQEYRDMTERLSKEGFPIFVTEFGITAASGGLPRDKEAADEWISLLEREGISWCMWSFSKVNEACSAIRFSVPKYSGFTEEDYSETGLWLLDTLKRCTGR